MKYYMRSLTPNQFREGMYIEGDGIVNKVIPRACSKRGTHVEFKGATNPTACYSPHVKVKVRITIEDGANGQENAKASGRPSKRGGGKATKHKEEAQRRGGNGRGSKSSGRPSENGGKSASRG